MKVHRTPPVAGKPPQAQTVEQFFRSAAAPRLASAPSAYFATVTPEQQPLVIALIKRSLSQHLGKIPAAKRVAIDELLANLGSANFYHHLAKFDLAQAQPWERMAKVQQAFAHEEGHWDHTTRAYSESMRLTLHAAVIMHFADPKTNQGMSLYQRFIALHPTAFHENGGWVDNMQMPIGGAVAVAVATPKEMWAHLGGLARGALVHDGPTVAAAELVRRARKAVVSGNTP
jgi:hypothetical protein